MTDISGCLRALSHDLLALANGMLENKMLTEASHGPAWFGLASCNSAIKGTCLDSHCFKENEEIH